MVDTGFDVCYKLKKRSRRGQIDEMSLSVLFYFFIFEIEEQFDNIGIIVEYSDNSNNREKPQKKYCWNGGKHGTTENTV